MNRKQQRLCNRFPDRYHKTGKAKPPACPNDLPAMVTPSHYAVLPAGY